MFKKLSENEIAYRRGFDQGAACFAYALGIDNDVLQKTKFKQRIKNFRIGKLQKADALWEPTPAELLELKKIIKSVIDDTPSNVEDAYAKRLLVLETWIKKIHSSQP